MLTLCIATRLGLARRMGFSVDTKIYIDLAVVVWPTFFRSAFLPAIDLYNHGIYFVDINQGYLKAGCR